MGGIFAGAILILTIISPSSKLHNEAISEPPKKVVTKEAPKKLIKQAEETKPIEEKKYIVETGDTMDSIAEKVYGSGKYWKTLWNDNDYIENPTEIRNGWELKIRHEKPHDAQELNPDLAKIYEELTATPSPTPTPSINVSQDIPAKIINTPPSSFEDTYKQAGSRFGVPWEILYGVHLVETGLRDGAISSGYGTGAQGPMQFMPGTWAAYGIDGNGDGNVDINSAVDAIFGAANYIALHGGVEAGLKAYGGDMQAMITAARSKGWNQ